MEDFGPPKDAKFAPVPDGTHDCVVVDVVDEGYEDHPDFGRKLKLTTIWETEAVNEETEERFQIRQKYTNTLHERGNWGKAIVAMLGRELTDTERKDIATGDKGYKALLIGVNCKIATKQKVTGSGRLRANPEYISDNPEGTLVAKDYKPKDNTPEGQQDGYNPFEGD